MLTLLQQLQLEKLKKQKVLLEQRADDYKREHGSEFFKPLEYQQRLIDLLHAGKKRLLLQGANQIGKTLLGACLVDSFTRGTQAWDGQQSIFKGRPTAGHIICTDWEYHANKVIVPKLKEVLPKGSYDTTRNNQGAEAFWTFPNGSTFELMTIKQDTQSHESSTLHWVWQDEPGPRDKYTANCRALIRHQGIYLISMTAVGRESWMLDEIALNTGDNYGCVTRIPMRANSYLTEEAILQYEKDCDELERPARVYGDWLQLTGQVIKNLDYMVHLIDEFPIPAHWPVVPFIDLHLSKKQAISFFAFDPLGREYQIDEVWEYLGPEDIAELIVKKKRQNTWNIKTCGIDPFAKGDANYLKNRYGSVPDSYSIIEEILDDEGIELFVASKDKDSGIRNIEAALRGINKMPALFFFREKTKMTIHQLSRWINDERGIPLKQNDDFPENLYRSTLLDEEAKQSEEPKIMPRDIFYKHSNWTSVDSWMAI